MVMDRVADAMRQLVPWNIMFADGIVICSESWEAVEQELEKWTEVKEKDESKKEQGGVHV